MKFVPQVIGKSLSRNALLAQKASPEVLFVAGVVGLVGSTVLACRATLKMEEVLDKSASDLDLARNIDHDDYSEGDRSRDITLIHAKTSIQVLKLYAPAIIVGGVSIAALTSSHNILKSRNVALTAAYGALDKGFRQYRSRVVEKYGEDQDRDFRYGTRKEKIVDEETGKSRTVTRHGTEPGADGSIYARFFDPGSTYWNREAEYNFIFLKSRQNYLNDRLHARGHVFLNEVYDELGLERSKAGAVVGWMLTKDGSTDNFIDFGIFDGKTQASRDFINGYEGSVLLDFNVDGVIFDKLKD